MHEQDDDLFNISIDPLTISPQHWQTIRQIARVAMQKYKCDYAKSIVIAYIEWLELGAMDKTQH